MFLVDAYPSFEVVDGPSMTVLFYKLQFRRPCLILPSCDNWEDSRADGRDIQHRSTTTGVAGRENSVHGSIVIIIAVMILYCLYWVDDGLSGCLPASLSLSGL
jgi:hypothetical protein